MQGCEDRLLAGISFFEEGNEFLLRVWTQRDLAERGGFEPPIPVLPV
jgi:hypothetical protein